MADKKRLIAVIGGSDCSPQENEIAEAVGRELARRGAVLVCGGMGGVMAAACKGAVSAGGMTVGILPGDSRQAANAHVQIPIVTGIGYARNAIVVKSAEAVIAIGGSYGTLSEISYALQGGLPVIGLNTWSMSRNGQQDQSIVRVKTPEEAVEMALDLIGEPEES